jgi:uncharacterized membrane protein YccC
LVCWFVVGLMVCWFVGLGLGSSDGSGCPLTALAVL